MVTFHQLKNYLSETSRWDRGHRRRLGHGRSSFLHLDLVSGLCFSPSQTRDYGAQSYSLCSFLVCLEAAVTIVCSCPLSCSQHSRLWATSHGFCQKTGFQTGAALLISIIIDCNYLTSPYIPRGTRREIQCFAKCSFYLCKRLQACSGVLLI